MNHSGDHVIAYATLFEQPFHSLRKVILKIFTKVFGSAFSRSHNLYCIPDELNDIQIPLSLGDDLNRSARSTTQSKRIGAAGGQKSHAHDSCNGVQLVCNRTNRTRKGRGQSIVPASGHIMFIDSLSHNGVFPAHQSIFLADIALQCGKFILAQHECHEVCLTKLRRAKNLFPLDFISTELCANYIGKLNDAQSLIIQRTQLCLKDYIFELGQIAL